MYTKLLWAADGSDTAELALVEGLRMLDQGGKLYAFHCDQRFVGGRGGGEPILIDETDRLTRIRERVAELTANGVDAELIVETTHHSAAHQIVKAADELGVEAIVCGTRGLGGLQGALLGSVARELLHHARVPVIVVPAKVAAPTV